MNQPNLKTIIMKNYARKTKNENADFTLATTIIDTHQYSNKEQNSTQTIGKILKNSNILTTEIAINRLLQKLKYYLLNNQDQYIFAMTNMLKYIRDVSYQNPNMTLMWDFNTLETENIEALVPLTNAQVSKRLRIEDDTRLIINQLKNQKPYIIKKEEI